MKSFPETQIPMFLSNATILTLTSTYQPASSMGQVLTHFSPEFLRPLAMS